MSAQLLAFALLALVGLGSAAMVVTQRNLVHSALYLVVTFFSVAGVYVVLHAEFLAAVQVLVYAGGIMVLFLFVIMFVEQPGERGRSRAGRLHIGVSAVLTALVTAALAFYVLGARSPGAVDTAALGADGGNLETVAMSLFRHYLLPFETVSVLLLVAMVGAIVLARPRV